VEADNTVIDDEVAALAADIPTNRFLGRWVPGIGGAMRSAKHPFASRK
jgi:hypothetical protein